MAPSEYGGKYCGLQSQNTVDGVQGHPQLAWTNEILSQKIKWVGTMGGWLSWQVLAMKE